jgi:hypothetical protein
MGTTLTGTTPQDTYDSLIKVTDNGPISGTAKYLSDGLGNDSVLALSTSAVGIGTATPSSPLDVIANNTTAIHLRLRGRAADNVGQMELWNNAQDARYAYISADSTSVGMATTQAIPLTFATNTAERMRITSAGNVGIGTTLPTELLHVNSGTGNVQALFQSTDPIALITFDDSDSTLSTIGLGCSGDNIVFYQDTEKMRISSAGNVGIGTGSPSAPLEVAGVAKATFSVLTSENSISSAAEASRFFAVSGDTGATSYNGTSIGQASIIGVGSTAYFVVGGFKPILPKGWTGTIVLEANANQASLGTSVSIQTSTDGSSWTTQGTAAVNGPLTYTASSGLSADTFLRIELNSGSGGSVSESSCRFSDLRINSYNVLMDAFHQGEIKYPSLGIASLSGGLAFNGDTASSNALDDYEEGTWTMGISFGGASTGVTYIFTTGNYTKIGRQVNVTGWVRLSSKGSSTGIAKITGLPFTNGAASQFYTAVTLGYIDNISFADIPNAYVETSATTIYFGQTTNAGALTDLTDANFVNNSSLMINATYYV